MHFATIFSWFPRCVCYYMKCVCIASLLHDCVLKGWKAETFFYSEGYVEWTQSTIQQSLKGIWIPFHQEWFVPSLVEIYLVVLKKKISFSSKCRECDFTIPEFSFLVKGCDLHIMSQVSLKSLSIGVSGEGSSFVHLFLMRAMWPKGLVCFWGFFSYKIKLFKKSIS